MVLNSDLTSVCKGLTSKDGNGAESDVKMGGQPSPMSIRVDDYLWVALRLVDCSNASLMMLCNLAGISGNGQRELKDGDGGD